MRKDLLYATGKVIVKERKQNFNHFFTMSLRNRRFEISCCACAGKAQGLREMYMRKSDRASSCKTEFFETRKG